MSGRLGVGSSAERLRVGCCAELAESNWRWVADALVAEPVDWRFFSTAPRNALERLVARPRLSRYRACRELAAAAIAGELDLIVTHHPLVTTWTETFCRARRTCPHLAFSFNFTHLPRKLRFAMMRRAFRSVDRFVVFSEFERELYSRYFEIPAQKIDMIPWGVREPSSLAMGEQADPGFAAKRDAICAVGSQARDYATLLAAMRQVPHIHLIIIATAANMRGLVAPPNVTVRLDIPRNQAEAIIGSSRFMVLPLLHSEVPCGHVTIVTAMYCSRAIVATDSAGIRDYVVPEQNGLVVPPGEPAALAAAIDRLWKDPQLARRYGENGRAFAVANCTEARMAEYVRALLARLRSDGRI